MPRKKSEDLLVFDETSPLLAPKKTKKQPAKKTPPSKPRKRGPKSKAELEEEAILAENERVAKRRAANFKPKTRKKPPNVKKPSDCKHIKRAEFKKLLNEKWKLLTEGTLREAESVGSWISGAARVIHHERPEEYEELTVLSRVAKQIARERDE